MNTYTFIKESGSWHIDFPACQPEFSKGDLALLEGAAVLLDFLSKGRPYVTFTIDTEPLEKALALELLQHGEAPRGGGYYQMRNHRGRVLEPEVWLCDIPLFVFGDIPNRIYVRKERPLVAEAVL